MNKRRILIGFAVIVFLSSAAAASFAAQTELMPPPPMHGLSGICADQQYLYVMADEKILQYEIGTLELKNTVSMPPLPPPPPSAPPTGMEDDHFPPFPPMGIPHGLWTGNGFLYVLAGHVVYQYSTPGLALKATVELPEPEFPDEFAD